MLTHNCSYAQPLALNSVKIKWVDFNMEAFANVSCEDLDHSFNDGEKRSKSIFNKKDLLHFQSRLKGLKPIKPLQSFDVRGSVNLIYSKRNVKYCFDVFGHFYKDGNYYFNKQLLIYISDKIFVHHPEYLDTLRQYE
ncbi:hypothetical protein [Mucilaginibacter polytrichastri]|nr:hypothetical protein [Mucilaginibacter polytrichastri]